MSMKPTEMASPLIHFEIISDDVDRSERFYRNVLNWSIKPVSMDKGRTYETGGQDVLRRLDYREIDTGTTITGALAKRPENATGPMLNVFFLVEDLENILEKVQKNEGKVIFPRLQIPGVGFLAMFEDPDGLQIGILQPEPEDKILRIKDALRTGQGVLDEGLMYSSDAISLAIMSRGE